MRILVCGGRDFTDRDAVFRCLDHLQHERGVTCVIDGAARGADTFAHEWAEARGVTSERYPANWNRDGKRAGPIRNAQMLSEGKPDGLIAFPGGRGTADMVAKSKAAGVPVWEPIFHTYPTPKGEE